MWRKVLAFLGAVSLATGGYIWFAPQHWYDAVPGVKGTGPLNLHFARDVALAYLVSGLALIWGGFRGDRPVALFGSAWLVAHALFHLWIWVQRGLPFDQIALANAAGIQLPSFAALIAAAYLGRKGARI